MLGNALAAVASGGALGAVARFITVITLQNFLGTRFGFGTMIVNTIGSFLAGLFMVFILERYAGNDSLRLFLVVGFLGGYTTFSSFSWETWVHFENGEYLLSFLNVVSNNVASLLAVFLGVIFGRWLGSII